MGFTEHDMISFPIRWQYLFLRSSSCEIPVSRRGIDTVDWQAVTGNVNGFPEADRPIRRLQISRECTVIIVIHERVVTAC
jgi:hypothetical protein